MTDDTHSFAAEFAALQADLADEDIDLPQIAGTGQKLLDLAEAAAEAGADGVTVLRVAVIGSLTTDFLVKAIACAAAQEGALARIYQAPFGALPQEIIDRGSAMHRFGPQIVVIAPDWRTEVETLPLGTTADQAAETSGAKIARYSRMWELLTTEVKARVIQHTLVPPVRQFCGPAERLAPASVTSQVETLNRGFLEAANGRVSWVEMDRLAARIGLDRFADEASYYTAKLPFSLKWLGDYLTAFRAAWRAATGRTKKVLVLDLDNTLWGGVIGDDGPDGIVLGPGTPTGEAFHAWGRYLKDLHARGVIMAVCSKNDPGIAAAGLDHAHMALRRDDFAAIECSWNDKASGLKRIAEQINVGIDSLVFADDNPAECEQVRRALPEVQVVHLGKDPSRFIGLLDRGRWFDLARYTAEDLGRGAAYAARAQALADEAAADGDMPRYLAGLQMVAKLHEADASELSRLAQMEQKTNQFNLTTRRFDEAALSGFMRDPASIVLAFYLADKFGDHGLVSSLVAVQDGDTLRIESWLMSCRVFSRTAEHYIMRHLIDLARARGLKQILGQYLPTKKNVVVADLFGRLGFGNAGEGWWRLDLAAGDPAAALETFITAPMSIAA
jgi:FkbH-like protein